MSWLLKSIHTDCRYYIGEKPCKYKRHCPGCPNYSPMGKRILILKLGAAGDAMRTTPILRELKKRHGRCHVTWATDAVSHELLKNNPFIDRLVLLNWDTALALTTEEFDVLYSADKAIAALALSKKIQAKEKFGFTLDKNGSLNVFNDKGAYALWLGISDPLKFERNEKTYQEITFDMLGFTWEDQEYVLDLTEDELDQANRILDNINDLKRPLIGFNTGAGSVFATKKWPAECFIELGKTLKKEMDCTLLIMGGTAEEELNQKILTELGALASDAGSHNPVRVFAGLVSKLDCLVTADTLAMHLAIASKTPSVALFGPTASAEVTLYGRGEIFVGKADCAPCYRATCSEEDQFACMKSIQVSDVADAIRKIIAEKPAVS